MMADSAKSTTAASTSSHDPGLLIIISGPSGVGKTTIARHVEKELGAMFSVSMTTREKTGKDVEGRDYYFVTGEAFEKARENGELLEWAEVFEGLYYGTPRKPVCDALSVGQSILLEIDVQGAIQVKQAMPKALAIFILPPGEDELLYRLRARGRESEPAIQKRFAKAKREIEQAESCGIYDHFIVNDDLGRACNDAIGCVMQRLQSQNG